MNTGVNTGPWGAGGEAVSTKCEHRCEPRTLGSERRGCQHQGEESTVCWSLAGAAQ